MKPRLFLGIDVPDRVIAAIEPVREAFGAAGMRVTRPELFHLTLVFIGDPGDTGIPQLLQAVPAVVDGPQPALAAAGAGVFRNRNRTKVGWIGVNDPGSNLQRLQSLIYGACFPGEPEPNHPAYAPHLTLARAPKEGRIDENQVRRILERYWDTPFGQWTVDELILFNSALEQGIRRYEPVARFPIPR